MSCRGGQPGTRQGAQQIGLIYSPVPIPDRSGGGKVPAEAPPPPEGSTSPGLHLPLLGLLILLLVSCAPASLDEHELLDRIIEIERSVAGMSDREAMVPLAELAEELVHSRIEVSSAVVAATYTRENRSKIYFGLTYDPRYHIYLAEIDPSFDLYFTDHRYWVSIIRTFDQRQLSFEVALDRETWSTLESGQSVSFTCELATLIRGKSVYCKLLDLDLKASVG